jgi:hypothetical protein
MGVDQPECGVLGTGLAPQNGRIRTLAKKQAKMSNVGVSVAIWWC